MADDTDRIDPVADDTNRIEPIAGDADRIDPIAGDASSEPPAAQPSGMYVPGDQPQDPDVRETQPQDPDVRETQPQDPDVRETQPQDFPAPAMQPTSPYESSPYASGPYEPTSYGASPYGQYSVPGSYRSAVGSIPPPSPYDTSGAATATSSMGTLPLVLGILSIAFAPCLGILALILGIVGVVKGTQVLRSDPTNGKAKAGRITGIIGVVLSLVFTVLLAMAVPVVISQVSDIIADDDPIGIEVVPKDDSHAGGEHNDSAPGERPERQGDPGAPGYGERDDWDEWEDWDDWGDWDDWDDWSGGELSQTDQEAAILAAEQGLAVLKDPPDPLKRELAEELDEIVYLYTGARFADAGATYEDVANWLIEDAACTFDAAHAYDRDDAIVSGYMNSRDVSSFVDAFYRAFDEYRDSDEYKSADDATRVQRIGEIVKSAMDGTGMTDHRVYVEVEREAGGWHVDDDMFEDMLIDSLVNGTFYDMDEDLFSYY